MDGNICPKEVPDVGYVEVGEVLIELNCRALTPAPLDTDEADLTAEVCAVTELEEMLRVVVEAGSASEIESGI